MLEKVPCAIVRCYVCENGLVREVSLSWGFYDFYLLDGRRSRGVSSNILILSVCNIPCMDTCFNYIGETGR